MATLLGGWAAFYTIAGSSAAALIGLQFVVMALVSESPRPGTNEIDAFGTPTIVHFSAVLLVSAVLVAPWDGLLGPHMALVTIGAIGIIYAVIVTRRAHRTTGYQPVLEDWIWHSILPALAYAGTFAGAVWLPRAPAQMLFVIAAMVLLLLFIGIHNAWDTITYIVLREAARRQKQHQKHHEEM